MTEIHETRFADFPALRMESDELAIVCIPELGGKIASLVNKRNGFDCAFVNPYTGIVKYPYDAPYTTSDCGIGELLPSIGVGAYPDAPWKGIPLPDKGELWTQGFETKIEGGSLVQRAQGVRFPYIFSRRLSLEGGRVRLDYGLENTCAFDFKYIWSMQPHLRLSGDMEIAAPEGASFFVDWSKNYRFDTATGKYRWPLGLAEGDRRRVDFSRIDAMNGDADKLYLADMARGEVSLIYHRHSQRVSFLFDTAINAYCGLWINKAGWPVEGNPTSLVAVQPCNCMSDFFEITDRNGAIGLVKAKSKNEWSVTLEIDRI
ncbi:MAG: hypothetical protein ABSF43_17395 [Rectinemataceae bacterium]